MAVGKKYNSENVPTCYSLYCPGRGPRGGGAMICVSTQLSSRLILPHTSIDQNVVGAMMSRSYVFRCAYVPPKCSDAFVHTILFKL